MQARGGGGVECIVPTHSQPCARGRWVASTTLRLLYHPARPGTYYAEGWVGLGECMDGTENFTSSGFNPWTIQPEMNHDYAIQIA